MEKIICNVCGTENEKEYKFCKNCGNDLSFDKSEKPKIDIPPVEAQPVINKQIPKWNIADDYDGVSAEEMVIFIGKKADKIMPKFSKMQITNSKVSWNWPVAVLGYLFGPLGSAIWFFYRKIYKPAVILTVIGAIVTIVTGVMTMGTGELISENAIDALASGKLEEAIEIFTSASENTTLTQKILSLCGTLINEFVGIATCVVTGVYGYYIYKKHCIKKIKEYRSFGADNRFYKIGLASIGGQSGGMLAVGIIIMIALENTVQLITDFIRLVL